MKIPEGHSAALRRSLHLLQTWGQGSCFWWGWEVAKALEAEKTLVSPTGAGLPSFSLLQDSLSQTQALQPLGLSSTGASALPPG